GVGFLLTVLMQSSSASIAVILTAVAGNVIGVSDAAAAVIGANVGTTSTAALAVIGATPNAKRLAGAHVVFNLFTGLGALILLPYFLSFIAHIDALFGQTYSATRFLALFHTVFNVVGVLVLYPFTGRLVAYLEKCFRSVEEDEGRARFLDGNVARTPVLALNALSMELRRVGEVARRMAGGAISSESGPSPRLYSDKTIIDSLVSEVAKFGKTIQRGNVPAELDHELPHALRVSGYYNDIAELSFEVATLQMGMTPMESDLVAGLNGFKHTVVKYLVTADSDSEGYSVDGAKEQLQLLREDYRGLKSSFLKSASKGELSVGQMVRNLDLIARLRRIAEQAEKGARYLDSIHKVKSSLENGTDVAKEASSSSLS
ncbi:MAG: Na/Pi symporter, partial [Desulfobulbaceae bacterium]|nr:Na/Pi symporter [Desulfobulbaceae bacterium]